jgi:hypothetical protein
MLCQLTRALICAGKAAARTGICKAVFRARCLTLSRRMNTLDAGAQ